MSINDCLLKYITDKSKVLTVLFIASILCSVAHAEEENVIDIATDNSVNLYLHKNTEIELTHGPHDAAIVENLIGLSNLYKDQGDHVKRLDVLKQALHVHRLNNGLESKDQLQIVEEIISTNNTLEDWKALDQNYEYYYWINRRIHGTNSLDLLPALNRTMEWKLDVLNRGLFGHPEIIKHQATDLLRKIRKIKKYNSDNT